MQHRKDKQTTIRIPAEELEHIKRLAVAEGRSLPDMIRRAIAKAYPLPKK